jgi:hypothetical protein
MIHLVLDTSVLLHDPYRRRASTETLEKLSDRDVVKVYLPNIVDRELRSNLLKRLDKNFGDSAMQIKKAAEQLALDGMYAGHTEANAIKRKLEEALLELEALRGRLPESTDASMARWLGRLSAARFAFAPHHSTRVFESYFADAPPFDIAKNKGSKEKREHIPDAFILEAVRELAADPDIEELHVVCHDNNLRACCTAVAGVRGYETVEAFLQEGPCLQYLIENDEYVYFNIERIREGVCQFTQTIFDAVKDDLLRELRRLHLREIKNLPSSYDEFEVKRFRRPYIEVESVEPYWDSLTATFQIAADSEVEIVDEEDWSTVMSDDRTLNFVATIKVALPSVPAERLEISEEAVDALMRASTFTLESLDSVELED